MATDTKQMLDTLFARIETEATSALTADLAKLVEAVANLAMATGQDDTMSIQEVAQILNIAERRAYELAKTEGFPAITIGKSVRVSRVAFFRWLQQRQVVELAA